MKQWEYMKVRSNRGPLTDELNQLGAEGWELVSISSFGWTFKREKEQDGDSNTK